MTPETFICKGCGKPLGAFCAKVEHKTGKDGVPEMSVEIYKTNTIDMSDNYYCYPLDPKCPLGSRDYTGDQEPQTEQDP